MSKTEKKLENGKGSDASICYAFACIGSWIIQPSDDIFHYVLKFVVMLPVFIFTALDLDESFGDWHVRYYGHAAHNLA